jgi:hypothetical protein
LLFDAQTRAFAALGGVARRGIYDNMKTAVDKVKKGKGRPRRAMNGQDPPVGFAEPARSPSSRHRCAEREGAIGEMNARQTALQARSWRAPQDSRFGGISATPVWHQFGTSLAPRLAANMPAL